MSKRMDGSVQVLRPQAIPIPQRDLYRKASHGSAARGSSGSWVAPRPEGLRAAVQDVSERLPAQHLAPRQVASTLHRASLEVEGDGDKLSVLPSSASLARCQRHNLRRIFVQTETGEVVVVEVDCATGGAEKVKRSVQAALNVPTEQADLMFGGHILEDLHELQNDVPVLLRRGITRSASSPCLAHSSLPTFPSTFSDSTVKTNPAPLSASQTSQHACAARTAEGSVRSKALFEVVGGVHPSLHLQRLIQDATEGVASGAEPVAATGGTGGAYYFLNSLGDKVVIVKPTDEEPFAPNNPNGYVGRSLGQPGLKKAIRVGEAGLREVAAYLLDHSSFAGVPYTALVRAAHPVFNVNRDGAPVAACGRNGSSSGLARELAHAQSLSSPLRSVSMGKSTDNSNGGGPAVPSKLCSIQQYVQHDYDTSECGTSRFPVTAVHRIGILDVRIFNTDRHSGNILVRRLGKEMFERRHVNPVLRVDEAVELVPIDHGFCLPETLEAAYFEWLHWPQASLPFMEEELAYIASLDVRAEVVMLREKLPMIREGSLRVLVLATTLLQRGAAAGLTLADIGAIMSREVRGAEEVASELEVLCLEAMRIVNAPLLPVSASPSLSSEEEDAEDGDLSGEEDDVVGVLSPARPSLGSEHRGWNVFESECLSLGQVKHACASPPLLEKHAIGATELPGLLFHLDDGVPSLEATLVPEARLSALWGSGAKTGPGLACPPSPRWQSPGTPRSRVSSLSSKVAVRLDFNPAGASPRTSALSSALRRSSPGALLGKAAAGPCAARDSGLLGADQAGPSAVDVLRKVPCRHESMLLKRFRQSGPVQQLATPRVPGGLSGLKLGSAGVAGSRVKALLSHTAEEGIDGALPGGGSFPLSEMEESEWQHFFEVYVDLIEQFVYKKASERSNRPEFFGTSCQW